MSIRIIRCLTSKLKHILGIVRIRTDKKVICLTFDDGPEPDITEFILETLDQYNAKGTFFCVGNNIQKNPLLYQRILSSGHKIGNHTMDHLKGEATDSWFYIKNVFQFHKLFGTHLFRPPFMSLNLIECIILSLKFKIVLWDVDSTDWIVEKEGEYELEELVKKSRNGSIVLFHFSQEHQNRTKLILPAYMKIMSEKGFGFIPIDDLS